MPLHGPHVVIIRHFRVTIPPSRFRAQRKCMYSSQSSAKLNCIVRKSGKGRTDRSIMQSHGILQYLAPIRSNAMQTSGCQRCHWRAYSTCCCPVIVASSQQINSLINHVYMLLSVRCCSLPIRWTMKRKMFIDDWFICSNDTIATIAIKHKTFELDKPGWIAALMNAHKRKKIHYG